MYREEHLIHSVAKILHAVENSGEAYPKKVTYTSVFTSSGQLPQSNGYPFSQRHTQTVIGVSSFQNMAETMADVLKRLSGDMKIQNKLLD